MSIENTEIIFIFIVLEANYVLFPPPILIIYVLINRAKNSVNYGAQDSGRHSLLDA